MADLCYVCHEPCSLWGTVYVGGATVGDEEVALCAECAEHVFPGMCEAMRANCPVCRAGGTHSSP